jgi:hypothetical protein
MTRIEFDQEVEPVVDDADDDQRGSGAADETLRKF